MRQIALKYAAVEPSGSRPGTLIGCMKMFAICTCENSNLCTSHIFCKLQKQHTNGKRRLGNQWTVSVFFNNILFYKYKTCFIKCNITLN